MKVVPTGSMVTRLSAVTRGVCVVSTLRMTFFSCNTL